MNISVFGASSGKIDPRYFSAAEELGRTIAEQGHCLIFGGGKSGLMGACASGACKAGGELFGIAPRFFDEPGILMKDECRFVFTDTMAERKSLMIEKADAFIALPGGIGTFEEFFETLTLKQLGQHSKPIALLNTLGYFDSFVSVLESSVEKGFMSANCLAIFSVCPDPVSALHYVCTAEHITGSMRRLEDYTR